MSKAKTLFEILCKQIPGAQPEYKFDSVRKWRFDFAIPHQRIAFEYEGIFAAKSRHTTISGYKGDIEKYNAAVKQGWRILRYHAGNIGKLQQDYESIAKLP